MKIIVLTVLFVILARAKGETDLPSATVCGNWDNEQLSPPFMFVIEKADSSNNCVGVLVTKEFLLTTTDCVRNIDDIEEIKIGKCAREKATPNECIFKPTKIIENKDKDIVLVKLDRDVSAQRRIAVCLDQIQLDTPTLELHSLHDKEKGKWAFRREGVRMVDSKRCRDIASNVGQDFICIESNNCRNLEPINQNILLMRNRSGKYILGGVMKQGSCLDDKLLYVRDIQHAKEWIKEELAENM